MEIASENMSMTSAIMKLISVASKRSEMAEKSSAGVVRVRVLFYPRTLASGNLV